jgi:hypothetical protein
MSDDVRDNDTGAGGRDGGSRLPPPASRRRPGAPGGNSKPGAGHDVDDALILPDDPIPGRARAPQPQAKRAGARAEVRGAFVASAEPSAEEVAAMADEDAFISPDEPIPHRAPVKAGQSFEVEGFDSGEGFVTGMGNDAHLAPEELALGGDPHLMELYEKVAKLAEALRRRGEAGLRATADMDRFEATLRAYCVGYVAGRRAGDPPPAE